MAKFDLNTRRVHVDVEIFESAKNNFDFYLITTILAIAKK